MRLVKSIPNLLTLTRLLMAVPMAYFLWHGRIGFALMLLVVAGMTDLMDGFVARHFNLRTPLGAWLDPLADKAIISTVLVTLTCKSLIPLWFCLATIGRDVGLALGILYLLMQGIDVRIQPLLTGKLATVAQNSTLLVAILGQKWNLSHWTQTLIVVSAALTAISFLTYGRAFFAIKKNAARPLGNAPPQNSA